MKNLFAPPFIELAYMLDLEWTHFYESPGGSFPAQASYFMFKNKNPVYSLGLVAGILLILLFRLIQAGGIWSIWHIDIRDLGFCLLIIVYFLLLSGPIGYAKYRVPFEPILILLTALPLARPGRNRWA